MSNWTRIGDNEVAAFGCQVFEFESPEGPYFIAVDEKDQDTIAIRHRAYVWTWPIYLKHSETSSFKLSGIAALAAPILVEGFWYELVIGPTLEITYWGDRVVHRTDLGRVAVRS